MPPRHRRLWISYLSALILLSLVSILIYSLVKMDYEWNFSVLWDYVWYCDEAQTCSPGLLLQGLWGTITISAVSILIGTIWGVFIGILLHIREPISAMGARFTVEIFRNTPVLVQLYVAYFVIGTAFDISAMTAGIATLALFCGAYIAEITRGELDSFEQGQIEAGLSLGFSPVQNALHVILPQATRRMIPPLIGQFVSLIKDSSLVSAISLMELTKAGMNVVAVSFRSFETWFLIALLYLVINQVVSSWGRRLEIRLGRSRAKGRALYV